MRRSTAIGLYLAGAYALYGIGFFAAAQFTHDVKGRVLCEQLAVAPAMLLLTVTRLIGPLTDHYPWTNNDYVFFGIGLTIMYLAGWGLGALDERTQRPSATGDPE